MKSNIKGPEHYKRGQIQPWDFIRDQELNYHLGNVVKYVCRAGFKNDDLCDLEKAIHYLENEIEHRTSERVQEIIPTEELKISQSPYASEIFDR